MNNKRDKSGKWFFNALRTKQNRDTSCKYLAGYCNSSLCINVSYHFGGLQKDFMKR